MKNNFAKFILIFLLFVISVKILHSAELLPTLKPKEFTGNLKLSTPAAPTIPGTKSESGIFGGQITSTTAIEIRELELAGYTCVVPGTSLSIRPIKGPTSYFIPSDVISKTKKRIPKVDGWTMGRYSGTKSITCTPPASSATTAESKTIDLDVISLYGTS